MTASVGFFALCASAFVPVRYFGLLSGVAMIVALGADLVLVPAILSPAAPGDSRPLGPSGQQLTRRQDLTLGGIRRSKT